MKVVVQRITRASVTADGIPSGTVGAGLLLLVGVARGDDETDAELLADKISRLRIFSDENGKLGKSVVDIGGEVLIISNFTLNGDYSHGNRPDFLAAEKPPRATMLWERFVSRMRERVGRVETGVFGADMQIDCLLDGPVTLQMDSELLRKGKQP